jgi:uncharacterized protein YdeI (YjbR/CyaY-like superfamily)
MNIGKTLYVFERKAWRAWLARHHKTEKEIWLLYYRKGTGKARISYEDAVEEALCYGWIDSTLKSLDKERYAQRFSVRKKTSGLSQMNRERVFKLIAARKMTKAGLAAIAHVFDPAKDKAEHFIVPQEILEAIKASKEAWRNFQKFPESYRRVRVAYIESRKRHGRGMFKRALAHFIGMTAKNKRIGSWGR